VKELIDRNKPYTHGLVVMYDISDRKSFENISAIREYLLSLGESVPSLGNIVFILLSLIIS
jgi:hypothetical protein